jgi:hypothetical protein
MISTSRTSISGTILGSEIDPLLPLTVNPIKHLNHCLPPPA